MAVISENPAIPIRGDCLSRLLYDGIVNGVEGGDDLVMKILTDRKRATEY